jgi:hypothetical protein
MDQTTKEYFDQQDAKSKGVREEVQAVITRSSLSEFIDDYLTATRKVGTHVFDPEELLGSRPGETLSPETVVLRDNYRKIVEQAKIDFLRRHGAEISASEWARTFAFMATNMEISSEVLEEMNIKTTN